MMRRRRKEPVMEFVTGERRAQELFPPRPAAQFVPDWWRRTPLQLPPENRKYRNICLRSEATIKGCPGVQDYLSAGYVLPLWTDYVVTLDEHGFATETPEQREIDAFGPSQWETCPRRDDEAPWVLKLHSPWKIVTPPGWSTLFLPTWFHRDDRFEIMPGIVDTDRHSPIIIVMTWRFPRGEPTLLKAGLPLVQLVPFRRERRQELLVTLDAERAQGLQRITDENINNRLSLGVYRDEKRNVQ